MSGLPTGVGESSAFNIFPKWIHVLIPAEHQGSNDEHTDPAVQALRVANQALQQAQETHAKMAKAAATIEQHFQKSTPTRGDRGQSIADRRQSVCAGQVAFVPSVVRNEGKPADPGTRNAADDNMSA